MRLQPLTADSLLLAFSSTRRGACVFVCDRFFVRACVRVSRRVFMRVIVFVYVIVRMRACVRARARARVCVKRVRT